MKSEREWLANCEAEPLAYSGATQGHGGFIHLDKDMNISHVSAQIQQFLLLTPAELLGKPLPPRLANCLAASLAILGEAPGSRKELFNINLEKLIYLDIVICRDNDGISIELSRHLAGYSDQIPDLVSIVAPQNSQEVMAMHIQITEIIHDLTGFNRVMLYVFREDGDGEVLAETRDKAIYGSYLGLRFPSSDIPHIARALYLKNPWRLIPDSQAPAIPLMSLQDSALDLSWSDLRSVSPLHQAYLANMGVKASLSFPIITVGVLSGLIACHHAQDQSLTLEKLRAASLAVQNYNLKLMTWQAHERMRLNDKLKFYFTEIQLILVRHGDLLNACAEISASLMPYFAACGLAVRFADAWAQVGEVPIFEELEQLDLWFANDIPDLLYFSDSLARSHPQLSHYPVSGAIGIKIRTRSKLDIQLWLFRQELIHEVEWGGNPNKPEEFVGAELNIAPRRSFEKFIEKRIGYCRAWSNEDKLKVMRLRNLLQEIYN